MAYEYGDDDDPIIDAIMSRRDDLPKIIDAHRDRLNKVSYMDGREYTPLFLAISLDRPKTVRLLLEHEADPLIPARHGVLPIHRAFTRPANLDIIRLLLDVKLVDKDTIKKMLNAPDHLGETALHHASHAWCTFDDRYELVKFMINLGARPRQNVVSKFPSEVYKDDEITQLLKPYEACGLHYGGYDVNNIKQDKVGREFKFDNNKTSDISKGREGMLEYSQFTSDNCQEVEERLKLDKENLDLNLQKGASLGKKLQNPDPAGANDGTFNNEVQFNKSGSKKLSDYFGEKENKKHRKTEQEEILQSAEKLRKAELKDDEKPRKEKKSVRARLSGLLRVGSKKEKQVSQMRQSI